MARKTAKIRRTKTRTRRTRRTSIRRTRRIRTRRRNTTSLNSVLWKNPPLHVGPHQISAMKTKRSRKTSRAKRRAAKTKALEALGGFFRSASMTGSMTSVPQMAISAFSG